MSREVHVPFYERLGVQFPRPTHRFCLSFRDVEDLLAQRGVTVSYEAIRQWCQTFGLDYARKLRRRRGQMGDTWYLDELFVTIRGRRHYLWRAVDQDGDILDLLVQSRRNRRAAVRFFRKLLKKPGGLLRRLVTDKLRSYSAAHRTVMPSVVHSTRQYENNRAELSPVDAATRAADARVQIDCARTTFLVGAWRRVESVPGGTPPAPSCAPSFAENALVRRLGRGHVCLLNDDGKRAPEGLSRPLLINLTVPVADIGRQLQLFATGSVSQLLSESPTTSTAKRRLST